MQSLKLLKKYIVDSQFFVSLMGTMLAVFFMWEQDAFFWPSVFLIFITYFSGYLHTKYQHHQNYRKILIINILTGIICIVLIFFNPREIRFLKWFAIVVLGLLYNSFFLERFVRKIPLLKVFYVGLVWALVNSWLILPDFSAKIFFISFLFITALVLPFDIRDMYDDNVVTFPKLIGVQNTKYLAFALIFLAAIIGIFFLSPGFELAFFLASACTFVLIYFSENSNPESYFSFWVELCSGLPLLFLILLQGF